MVERGKARNVEEKWLNPKAGKKATVHEVTRKGK